MGAQGVNYKSSNINSTTDRYISLSNENPGNKKRLGDRTLFSQSTDGKRYFSSLDAEIYFGESFIDNMIQITWGVEQATMPLFGYNSYTFDDLAIGARQISGSFVVNFTKSGFMYDVLKSVQAVNRSSFNVSEDLNNQSSLSWTSHFDKEHKSSWNRSFNIRVGYGDQSKGGADTTMTVLHCVQITGCQQVLGVDGAPIAEAYTFIAKDIRYEISGMPEKDPAPTTDSTSSTDTETAKDNFVLAFTPISITKTGGSSTSNKTEEIILPEGVDAVSGAAPQKPHVSIPKYFINIKYECGGGEVNDIGILMKRENGEAINTSYISIGNKKEISFEVPSEYNPKIERVFNSQSSLGATSFYLICDFQFSYSKGGKIQVPKFEKNKKVFLAQ